MQGGCTPEGKIASSSNTKECEAELSEALEAFGRDLGLAYTVEPSDAKSIFETGKVEKNYARDGVQHGSHFGLEKTEGGCSPPNAYQPRRRPAGPIRPNN